MGKWQYVSRDTSFVDRFRRKRIFCVKMEEIHSLLHATPSIDLFFITGLHSLAKNPYLSLHSISNF